jgi:hypothetical protein
MIIFIPSCNRAEMAWNLCNQLKKAERIVLCVNNCSVFPYYEYKWNDNVHIQYFEFKGDPKLCHNLTFQRMLQIPDNDILVLEDDVVLCEDFLGKLNYFIKQIESYQLEQGISQFTNMPFAFTPIYIPEKKCNYTEAVSKDCFEKIGYKVFTQKYVDGIFYMSKHLHSEVKSWFFFASNEVPVLKSSSGIGKFLSNRIYSVGLNMYGISPSLIGHGDHESIQFGEKRKQVPLIAKI